MCHVFTNVAQRSLQGRSKVAPVVPQGRFKVASRSLQVDQFNEFNSVNPTPSLPFPPPHGCFIVCALVFSRHGSSSGVGPALGLQLRAWVLSLHGSSPTLVLSQRALQHLRIVVEPKICQWDCADWPGPSCTWRLEATGTSEEGRCQPTPPPQRVLG